MTDTQSSMKSLKAYEKIRDMILEGHRLPGTRLILADLEQEMGIGRGPIREALMRLDRSGLVKNIPYKGAVVATPPTRKEVLHIYDLRVDLEVKLALEAMEHLNAQDILELETIHARMQEFPVNHYHLDSEFHAVIYEASNLPYLCTIATSLRFSVESLLNIYRREKEHCLKFNREHGAIIDALKNRDPDSLRKHLSTNIKSGLEIIKETYLRLLRVPFD